MSKKPTQSTSLFHRPEGKAILISISVGAVIIIIKILAYWVSGSMSAMVDMLESLVHNLAVLFAAFSLWYSYHPPDDNHLYGHGKIQFFSAAVEGGFVCGSAILIFARIIEGFLFSYELMDVFGGAAYAILAAAINAVLGWYLIAIGNKHQSLIVRANGYHVLSDVITTGAALIGMIGAKLTGLIIIDLLAATLGGIYIFLTGMRLLQQSFSGLMDEADQDVDRIVREVLKNESNEHRWRYHALRHRSEGNRHFVDLHLVFQSEASLQEAHDQASHLETELQKAFDAPVTVTTHLEPDGFDKEKIEFIRNNP